MGDPGEHQEQSQLGEAGLAQGGGEAELVGELLEGVQQAEDGAAGGFGGQVIEVAAEGAAEGFDAGGVPVGEVGEGAFDDPFTLAQAFAEEDGGRGGAVGDGIDVHGHILSHTITKCKHIIHITWAHKTKRGQPFRKENSGT